MNLNLVLLANQTPGFAIGVTALVISVASIYFAPSLVAVARHKNNVAAIVALNLFLGWTLLGWVLALVWALSVDQHEG